MPHRPEDIEGFIQRLQENQRNRNLSDLGFFDPLGPIDTAGGVPQDNPLFPLATDVTNEIPPLPGTPVPEGPSRTGQVLGGIGSGIGILSGLFGGLGTLKSLQDQGQADPSQIIAARRLQAQGQMIARNQQGGPPRLPNVGEPPIEEEDDVARRAQAAASIIGIIPFL